MDNLEFKRKYMKYKNKYLQLKQKEQTGGSSGTKTVFDGTIENFKKLVDSAEKAYEMLEKIMHDKLKDLEKTRSDITSEIKKDREKFFKGGFCKQLTISTLESLDQYTTGVGYTVYLNTLFGLKDSHYLEFEPRKDNFFSSIGTKEECLCAFSYQDSAKEQNYQSDKIWKPHELESYEPGKEKHQYFNGTIKKKDRYRQFEREYIYNDKVCYICGEPLEGPIIQSSYQCEHILSIFDATCKNYLLEGPDKISGRKAIIYDGSHECCNQFKSNLPFIRKIKGNKFVAHKQNIKNVLAKIWNGNRTNMDEAYDCHKLLQGVGKQRLSFKNSNKYISLVDFQSARLKVIEERLQPILDNINKDFEKLGYDHALYDAWQKACLVIGFTKSPALTDVLFPLTSDVSELLKDVETLKKDLEIAEVEKSNYANIRQDLENFYNKQKPSDDLFKKLWYKCKIKELIGEEIDVEKIDVVVVPTSVKITFNTDISGIEKTAASILDAKNFGFEVPPVTNDWYIEDNFLVIQDGSSIALGEGQRKYVEKNIPESSLLPDLDTEISVLTNKINEKNKEIERRKNKKKMQQ